jgi:uncharacterized protein (TIGR00297 family)
MALVKILLVKNKKNNSINSYMPINFIYTCVPLLSFGVIAHKNNNLVPFEVMALVTLGFVISDTISSDFGESLKCKTILITTLKETKPGTDGGISTIGTTAGILSGMMYVLLIYTIYPNVSLFVAIKILLIILIGNIVDSVLGATLQKAMILNNEQVNFFSIAIIAILSAWIFYG